MQFSLFCFLACLEIKPYYTTKIWFELTPEP